jgi:hypothetical protein
MSTRTEVKRGYCNHSNDDEPFHLVCCVRLTGPTVSVCGVDVSGMGVNDESGADCKTCREKNDAFPDNCPVFGRCIG